MFRKRSEPVITDTAPCEKAIRLQVGHEAIAPVRAAVLEEFQRTATLPGFRKGKAPADLIARQYAEPIQRETLHRVTQQAIEETAKAHRLKPVGPFELKKADLTEQDGLLLEAVVEVEPEFALGAYKGIPLARPSVEVTAAEVENALGTLQESMARLAPSAEGTKERQVPLLDDELAKDLGFDTLPKLSAHVEAKLREQKRAAAQQALEAALCDELVKRHAFQVPPRLVSHQAERLTRDFKARLLLAGTPEEKLEEKLGKFTEGLRTSAERHVKLAFIMDRIAAQEQVTLAQDELLSRLWQLAQRWRKDPTEVRKILDAQQLWPSVASAIRQEKTMALLLKSAVLSS